MTDWHCRRCRHRVRIDWHARGMLCPVCEEHMRRGVGRGTTTNVRLQVQMRVERAEAAAEERRQS